MKAGSARRRSADTRREFCSQEALACSSEMCHDASNGKLRKLTGCHTTAHLAGYMREEEEGEECGVGGWNAKLKLRKDGAQNNTDP